MAALLVLLLSVGALFCASNAQENYDKLPVHLKKGVDLALENLNSRALLQHHFLFFKSLLQSDIQVLCNMCALQSQCLSFVVLWLITDWFPVIN